MALPVPYLSISQINMYLTCPKKYYYRYCEGILQSLGSPLLVGSSFHKVIEEANKKKKETGKLIKVEEMEDIYNKHWNKKEHEIDWEEDEKPEEEKERGLILAKAYLEDDIGKNLNPIGFEAKFDVTVEGIPFHGYIDLIEDGGFIRDLKTSKKTPSNTVADNSLQLAGYSYAYRYMTGVREAGASLDYAISLKNAPKIERFDTKIDDNRIDRFTNTFYHIAEAIDREIYYRNEGMACSWCSYKDICKG